MRQDNSPYENKLVATKPYLRGGMLLVGGLIFGVVGWSLMFKIQNGIIAPGVVTIVGETKTVQHLEGGSIKQVHVREGDLVQEGDPLLTLDTTVLTANKAQWERQNLDLTGQIARLTAEKNNQRQISFPRGFRNRATSPDVQSIMTNQNSIFDARMAAMNAAEQQLNQRRLQYENQRRNLSQQASSYREQLGVLEGELARLQRGRDLGVVSQMQLDTSVRERISLIGQVNSIETELGKIDNQIHEAGSGFEQAMQEREERIHQELRESQSVMSDVTQKLEALKYQLGNSVVKSPVSGLIHDLQVTTINGVVKPGESLLKIVPNSDAFSIKASVSPTDIDQIFSGQDVMVRFSAFNQTTTPMVAGKVSYKSADHIIDKMTGQPYFEIKVEVSEDDYKDLEGLTIQAGMPSEVYLQTEKRSVASYLVKPVKDAMTRIGRSE